jgi:hypothetical protein
MMAGIIAAYDGWSFHYLGPDLPGSAIGSTMKRLDARLVAVSIVAPIGAAQSARELLALRRAVGSPGGHRRRRTGVRRRGSRAR